MRQLILPVLLLSLAPGLLADSVPTPRPARQQRLADARAVEEVYWRHRLWPASNGGVKPPLEEILPDTAISARVEDALRKTEALRIIWDRPITAAQLQAELDRIASHTRNAAILGEIFSALGNDPVRIAESLARPALVNRLIQDWYAMDGRFHAEVLRRAEEESARIRVAGELRRTAGDYSEIEYVLRRDSDPEGPRDPEGVVALELEEWERLLASLAGEFGSDVGSTPAPIPPAADAGSNARRLLEALPSGRPGSLQEDADGFSVHAVLAREPGLVRLATVVWRKRPFDEWWKERRRTIPATVPAVSAGYTLPALAADCANDTWRPMRTESPYGRKSHSAIWTGSEMIVWGGNSPTGPLKTGYRYQPATDTWTPIRSDDTAPAARGGHAAVWAGIEMVVWSGTTFTNTGGRYNPVTDTWRPTRADATTPAPREQFAAVWTGSEMFVWGGLGCVSNDCYINTGGLYNPVSDTWRATSLGVGVPERRATLSAIWTGSEVIVYGGYKQGTGFPPPPVSLDTGARYNPSTNTWTPIAGGVPRTGHTAVWTESEMIVWGGSWHRADRTTTTSEPGYRYAPSSNSWTPMLDDATEPVPRPSHSAVWTGTKMIVWGGGSTWITGGQYDPSTNTWAPTRADATTPTARSGQTAVWTGTEMIVWGGSGPGGLTTYTNTGGRYDPVSDTWVPTHAEPIVPGGAPRPPGIWTGSEMIFVGAGPVAGRYDPATDQWSSLAWPGQGILVGDLLAWTGTEMLAWSAGSVVGARFNPTTGTWAAMSVQGAPASGGYTVVWTGHEMIVWSGSGGRYDPVTDTWTPTRNDASTPAARGNHSAVWTGDEMVVWGGVGPSNTLFNTGGRYDPGTDTWTATAAQPGVPDRRYWHSAIWSGNEMIIWGGDREISGPDPLPNTGWAYSPSSDGWRAIAVDAFTPSGRQNHAAVWTGREMIVWGGRDPDHSSTLSTGGRYDPLADGWTATRDDATTPIRRWDAAAAWTGREMLIWGGNLTPNTGAGYCTCLGPTETWFQDADGDGFGDAGSSLLTCVPPAGYVTDGSDCSDGDAGAWATPGEARDLIFTTDVDLSWGLPEAPGAASLSYDLIRTSVPSDFVAGATCVVSDISGTAAVDSDAPAIGEIFHYLVRAENACPSGAGDLGTGSDGAPRVGRACP